MTFADETVEEGIFKNGEFQYAKKGTDETLKPLGTTEKDREKPSV